MLNSARVETIGFDSRAGISHGEFVIGDNTMDKKSDQTMSMPFQALTKSQRFWYAEMLIAAILADGEISKPETNFIKQIVHLIKNPDQQKELLNRIANKTPPPINRPSGMSPQVMAAVFIELCLVLISDAELTDEEINFLSRLSDEFTFSDAYFNELMDWCHEGLAWKTRQLELVAAESKTDDLTVPVEELNTDQLFWYATVLVSTIMSDQQLDASEVKFLKMAIGLVKDPGHQQELTEMVRMQTVPELSPPPEIPKNILVRIFFEVMLIISADESLEEEESGYLKKLSDLCGFSESRFQDMIDWCRQGIKWKRAKNPLISRCELKQGQDDFGVKVFQKGDDGDVSQSFLREEDSVQVFAGDAEEPETVVAASEPESYESLVMTPDTPLPEKEPNKESNSITDFNLGCFVCGSTGVVKHFQLKPKSIQVRHDVFGIPVYRVSADGFDFVDYNTCKVTICPSCLFASTQKQMFKLAPDMEIPKVMSHPDFKKLWLSGVNKRRRMFQDQQAEFNKVNRAFPFVVDSYEMAIESSELLARLNNSDELEWHAVTLKLTLAEIYMGQGKMTEAIEWLKAIHKKAMEIFKSSKKRFIKFRSGRLILLLALYFGNTKAAGNYLKYFTQLKDKQYDRFKESDQVLFKKVYGEMKRAFESPALYSRKGLKGFMLDADEPD